jgi:hypothetical protein
VIEDALGGAFRVEILGQRFRDRKRGSGCSIRLERRECAATLFFGDVQRDGLEAMAGRSR